MATDAAQQTPLLTIDCHSSQMNTTTTTTKVRDIIGESHATLEKAGLYDLDDLLWKILGQFMIFPEAFSKRELKSLLPILRMNLKTADYEAFINDFMRLMQTTDREKALYKLLKDEDSMQDRVQLVHRFIMMTDDEDRDQWLPPNPPSYNPRCILQRDVVHVVGASNVLGDSYRPECPLFFVLDLIFFAPALFAVEVRDQVASLLLENLSEVDYQEFINSLLVSYSSVQPITQGLLFERLADCKDLKDQIKYIREELNAISMLEGYLPPFYTTAEKEKEQQLMDESEKQKMLLLTGIDGEEDKNEDEEDEWDIEKSFA